MPLLHLLPSPELLVSRFFRGQPGKDLSAGLGGSEPSRGRDCSQGGRASKTRAHAGGSRGWFPSVPCQRRGGGGGRAAAAPPAGNLAGLSLEEEEEGRVLARRLTRGGCSRGRLGGWRGAVSLRRRRFLGRSFGLRAGRGWRTAWGTLAGKAPAGSPLQRPLQNTGCGFKNRVPPGSCPGGGGGSIGVKPERGSCRLSAGRGGRGVLEGPLGNFQAWPPGV